MSIFDKDVLKGWFGMHWAKMLLTTACLVFGYLSYYMKDEIKDYVFPPQEVSQTGKPKDFSLPTSVSAEDQSVIKVDMKQMLRKSDLVGALFLFEFAPEGNQLLYQGRALVTQANNADKDLATRYNQNWIPMPSDVEQMGHILKGEKFWRNINDVSAEAGDKKFTIENLRLVKQDGYQYVVSVPVISGDLTVRGYLSAYLVDIPTNTEFDALVEDLEYQANEFSRYL